MKLLQFLVKYQEDTERIRKAHNHPDLFMFFSGSYAAIASLIEIIQAAYPETVLIPKNDNANGE